MAGRPRDADLEQRFLAAAWKLLSRDGYEAMTMVHVAAAAGAHRTDLYRRWPTKARLAVAAMAEHLPPIAEVDTGSLKSDLRAWVEDLATSWSSPWIDGLVGALADLRSDSEAGLTFFRMTQQRGQQLARALHRAVERGEIAEMPDGPLLADLIEGPMMHRRLFSDHPLDPQYLDLITETALWTLTRAGAGIQEGTA